MSAVRESAAQHYYRVFTSINGRRIYYEYVIAANNFR